MSGVQPIFRAGLFRPALWDDGWMWWCQWATGPRANHCWRGPHPHSFETPPFYGLKMSRFIGVNHGKSWQISCSWFLGGVYYGEVITWQPGTEILHEECDIKILQPNIWRSIWQRADRIVSPSWTKKSGHTTEEPAQQPEEAQQSLVLMLRSAPLGRARGQPLEHGRRLSWISQICPNITIYYYNITNIYIYMCIYI